MNKKRIIVVLLFVLLILSVLLAVIVIYIKKYSKTVTAYSPINVDTEITITEEVSKEEIIEEVVEEIENKPDIKVIDGITYVNGILLVNKKYNLPSTYNPGVDSKAKSAFEEMRKSALKDKISLKIVSGFRSYNSQKAIYNSNVKKHGTKIANRFSAKAGQSEHQTGLAFDLNQANRSFVGTKEAKWLANNCYKYGFIIRYPENKEKITGYVYEPWHVRYIGKEVAKDIHDKGICLEEYLNVN